MTTARTCISALSRLTPDAPDGLRYWLQHNSPGRSWLDAPRPEWLIYLMSRYGYGPAMVHRARNEIDYAGIAAERTKLAGEKPTATVDACASIVRLIVETN